MKKNEKLKALATVAEGFGLTAKEVIAYFGKAYVRVQRTKTTKVVQSGMYYYSDGTISADILSDKQISGVVGWVDDSGQHGLVLGLRETRLPWSSDCLVVNLPKNADGKENTRLILEAVHKQNKKAEAAEWCAAYAFDGIHAGEAFLPSSDELVKIFKNLGVIQKALKKINQPQLRENDCYWLSSEYDNDNAWDVSPSDGDMNYYYKSYHNDRVRCVLAFRDF